MVCCLAPFPTSEGKSQQLLDGQTSQNLLIKFRAKLQPDVLRMALLGMDPLSLDPTMVLQCLGGYPKQSDVELVSCEISTFGAEEQPTGDAAN